MYLKNIKLTDLEKEKKYCFIIPIGSTEQHGPFLPFGTDTYLGDEVIKGIEKNLQDLIITPTLEFSCSEEHQGFMGTMWLKPETLVCVLRDLCTSLAPYAKDIIL
ncbi:MAG: creatininase family protein, partial [Nanoarchaeota archaeon]|nr:creatininase family protein [Nanoarchaeota archaeon]